MIKKQITLVAYIFKNVSLSSVVVLSRHVQGEQNSNELHKPLESICIIATYTMRQIEIETINQLFDILLTDLIVVCNFCVSWFISLVNCVKNV